MIFQMGKVMPTFEYELLVFFLEPETLNEEKDRRNTNSVGPLGTKTSKDKLRDLRRGKYNLKKKANAETYASKQTLEQ
jgi:hypothetical protein